MTLVQDRIPSLASRPHVLEQIYDSAVSEPTAVLCLEADWVECHRSILFEQIAATIGPVELTNL